MNRGRLARLSPSILIVSFLLFFLAYLYTTRKIVGELREDEVTLMRGYGRFWATAFSEGGELEILQEVFRNIDFPVVVIDRNGKPIHWENLDIEEGDADPRTAERVREIAARLDRVNEPFRMAGPDGEPDFATVHYGVSHKVASLEYIPYLQGVVLVLFGLLAVLVIRYNLRSEKSLIWVGLARESAHQLGTPLSSLQGWLEILDARRREGGEIPAELPGAMRDDIARLTKVANRFESIGRETMLGDLDLEAILRGLESYFGARLPAGRNRVELSLRIDPLPAVSGNRELLEWAFENLIKNGLDALEGMPGRIEIRAGREGDGVKIDFRDTGSGIPREIRRRVFQTGVTTKPAGWGVGLALARRIVEEYHGGSLRLVATGAGGTHFRVTLRAGSTPA